MDTKGEPRIVDISQISNFSCCTLREQHSCLEKDIRTCLNSTMRYPLHSTLNTEQMHRSSIIDVTYEHSETVTNVDEKTLKNRMNSEVSLTPAKNVLQGNLDTQYPNTMSACCTFSASSLLKMSEAKCHKAMKQTSTQEQAKRNLGFVDSLDVQDINYMCSKKQYNALCIKNVNRRRSNMAFDGGKCAADNISELDILLKNCTHKKACSKLTARTIAPAKATGFGCEPRYTANTISIKRQEACGNLRPLKCDPKKPLSLTNKRLEESKSKRQSKNVPASAFNNLAISECDPDTVGTKRLNFHNDVFPIQKNYPQKDTVKHTVESKRPNPEGRESKGEYCYEHKWFHSSKPHKLQEYKNRCTNISDREKLLINTEPKLPETQNSVQTERQEQFQFLWTCPVDEVESSNWKKYFRKKLSLHRQCLLIKTSSENTGQLPPVAKTITKNRRKISCKFGCPGQSKYSIKYLGNV